MHGQILGEQNGDNGRDTIHLPAIEGACSRILQLLSVTIFWSKISTHKAAFSFSRSTSIHFLLPLICVCLTHLCGAAVLPVEPKQREEGKVACALPDSYVLVALSILLYVCRFHLFYDHFF